MKIKLVFDGANIAHGMDRKPDLDRCARVVRATCDLLGVDPCGEHLVTIFDPGFKYRFPDAQQRQLSTDPLWRGDRATDALWQGKADEVILSVARKHRAVVVSRDAFQQAEYRGLREGLIRLEPMPVAGDVEFGAYRMGTHAGADYRVETERALHYARDADGDPPPKRTVTPAPIQRPRNNRPPTPVRPPAYGPPGPPVKPPTPTAVNSAVEERALAMLVNRALADNNWDRVDVGHLHNVVSRMVNDTDKFEALIKAVGGGGRDGRWRRALGRVRLVRIVRGPAAGQWSVERPTTGTRRTSETVIQRIVRAGGAATMLVVYRARFGGQPVTARVVGGIVESPGGPMFFGETDDGDNLRIALTQIVSVDIVGE